MNPLHGNDRDRADWGADPDLLELLKRSDPAHSLPPRALGAADVSRLVEVTLAAARAEDGVTGQQADELGALRSRRRRLAPLVAAAAVVAVAGAGSFALSGRGDDSSPTAGGAPASATPTAPAPTPVAPPATGVGPTVLTNTAQPDSLKCMVPNAEVLSQQQLAFEGTVVSVADGTAVLDATTVFTGDVAPQVQVQAPSEAMGQLLSAVQFEVGKTYLVSASDGQVSLCGFSAEVTPDLESLYQQAFAG